MVGQYISEGMASAMAEVLKKWMYRSEGHGEVKSSQKEEDKVQYIPVKEVNFDDNGLKDGAFAEILKSLATQNGLKRISYVNNEIGEKTVEILEKMLTSDNESALSDLRLTRVKSTKNDLNQLI